MTQEQKEILNLYSIVKDLHSSLILIEKELTKLNEQIKELNKDKK
jgi:hypothetical protein